MVRPGHSAPYPERRRIVDGSVSLASRLLVDDQSSRSRWSLGFGWREHRETGRGPAENASASAPDTRWEPADDARTHPLCARRSALRPTPRGTRRSYRAGTLDIHDVDEVIHHYHRAARELWKFCWSGGVGAHIEIVARLIEHPIDDEAVDWWQCGAPRERGER